MEEMKDWFWAQGDGRLLAARAPVDIGPCIAVGVPDRGWPIAWIDHTARRYGFAGDKDIGRAIPARWHEVGWRGSSAFLVVHDDDETAEYPFNEKD